jgi:hypothetical protein
MKLRLDSGTDAEADAVAPLVFSRGLAQQQRGDDAEIVHDRGLRLGDLPPPAERMEAVWLDLAAAA